MMFDLKKLGVIASYLLLDMLPFRVTLIFLGVSSSCKMENRKCFLKCTKFQASSHFYIKFIN